MFRLALKLALAAAAVWAVWSFVPVNGRTGAERWRSARSLSAFVDGAIAELTGSAKPPPRPQARQKPAPAPRPTESHTESDRRAVERILADRLDER